MAPHHAPHVRAREQNEADARHQEWLEDPNEWGDPDAWPPNEHIERPYISPQKEKAIYIQSAITRNDFTANKDFVFTEGNYDLPLAGIRSILEPLDLWDVAQTEILEDTWKDKRAFYIIQAFIHKRFLKEWNITLLTPSHEVLRRLRAGCKPFRLMDLPRELRDNIYEYMGDDLMVDKKDGPVALEDGLPGTYWNFLSYTKMVKRYSKRRRILGHSLNELASVCREFRYAFTKLYFGRNAFSFGSVSRHHDEDVDFEEIVQHLGLWRLVHLRDLRVTKQGRTGTKRSRNVFYWPRGSLTYLRRVV